MTDYIKPNRTPTFRPFILGVAGGSGSGKTFFAKALLNTLGTDCCQIVYQDNFYFDQSNRFDFDGGSVNFDHPDSIDFLKLADCLMNLKSGHSTEIPSYDFSTHQRRVETLTVLPKPIIIVDGILIFHSTEVRNLCDDLVFFDTPEDLRFRRRMERDIVERGRTPDGVRQQFYNQVKPMHDLFVEPSKEFANFIVKDLGNFETAIELYLRRFLDKKNHL